MPKVTSCVFEWWCCTIPHNTPRMFIIACGNLQPYQHEIVMCHKMIG